MFKKMAWVSLITLLTAGLGVGLFGCSDDDGSDNDQDTDSAIDTGSEQEVEHNVKFTIKLPEDYTGDHNKLAAVYYDHLDLASPKPPGGFAGETVDDPDLTTDTPYVWNGKDSGLDGKYELIVIFYAPGDVDFLPDPGDYWKVVTDVELGGGDIDLGEIVLEPFGDVEDTDKEVDGGTEDGGSGDGGSSE